MVMPWPPLSPTAQTSLLAIAATPFSVVMVGRFGLGTIDHAVPFQCSVSDRNWPWPTAQASVPDTAATAFRTFWPPPLGLGLGTTVHPPTARPAVSGKQTIATAADAIRARPSQLQRTVVQTNPTRCGMRASSTKQRQQPSP